MLIVKILHFAVTDTVLAGASAAHPQGALHGLLREPVRFLELRGIFGIKDA